VDNDGWTPYLISEWESLVGYPDQPPVDANVVRGVAEVDFDDGPTIDLPVAVWNNPSINPVNEKGSPPSRSVFGIGRSSDLIRSFLNESFVPSGYMGLYFGSRSLNCSEDGELTIGGWDEARATGSFVNYTMNSVPMNTTCPLQVRVKALTLNSDEGAHPLIGDGQSIGACIDPFQNSIGLTDALYSIWANLTQHRTEADGPPFTDQTYPLANERLIDTLDIELEGGYSTTVSHCELVSLQRGANLEDVGEYTVINNSRIMASVSHGQTDLGTDFGILLGGAFLASTYLRIDYETNQFSLAPCVSGRNILPNIHKQCSKDTSIPSKTNGTIPAATTTSPSTGNSSHGLSTDTKATIGGAVAGGVIALVGVAIAWLAYQHAQRSEAARRKSEAETLGLDRPRTLSTYKGMSPMPSQADAVSPKTYQSVAGKPSVPSVELPKSIIGEN
jgi:hypothetical protein